MKLFNILALAYVDLDDDDSMDVAMETPTPPFDVPKMPHSEMAKPTETPEDLAAKEEKPAPGKEKETCVSTTELVLGRF